MDTVNFAKITTYIDENPLGVVSTLDPDGTPYGSVVYICTDIHHPFIYFITKNETRKFKNIARQPDVSLTIFNEKNNSTLQAKGRATLVNDTEVINNVTKQITRAYAAHEWLPPIAKLKAGAYEMVQVEVTEARLAEYRDGTTDNPQFFTEA